MGALRAQHIYAHNHQRIGTWDIPGFNTEETGIITDSPQKNKAWHRLLAGLLLVISSCSYYSTTSGLPGHIKAVGVGFFDNYSVEAGLDERLARAITDKLLTRTDVTFTAARAANAVFEGTIKSVTEGPSAYGASDQARRFRITVSVEARFVDRLEGDWVWDNDSLYSEVEYDPAGGNAARQKALDEAAADLSSQIVDRATSGW